MGIVKDVSQPMQIARRIFGIFWIIVFCIVMQQLFYWNIIPQKSYTAEDFGITILKSQTDYNGNGIDDYTDFVSGARAYIQTNPEFKAAYYKDGYPPQGEGMSTDVIWYAFASAGYDFKSMVDADILANPKSYTETDARDPESNFRRVYVLKEFFERNAESLTHDPTHIAAWQPGDIVFFNNDVAIVSDKRNKDGISYIIHHGGQPVAEENALHRRVITGHYRWR